MRAPNFYAHPGFERAGLRRRDTGWILERVADPGSMFVPVWRNQNLIVELEGADHLFFTGDADSLLDEIEEFLTGVRPLPAVERVLATVLFTDIVDSTKRAVELGDERWKELLGRHDAHVRRQLERFHGREVNTTGDGLLSEFASVVDAVRCAVEVQREMAARNAGVQAERRIDFRIGINLSDIIIDEDDIFGVIERLLVKLFRDVANIDLTALYPDGRLPRMTYAESMRRFGDLVMPAFRDR